MSVEAGAHGLRNVAALLHRNGRDTGKEDGITVRRSDSHHVADHEDLGMTGKGEIGPDRHSPGAVRFGPAEPAQVRCEARCGDAAGGPDDGAAGICSGVEAESVTETPFASTPTTVRPVRTVTSSFWSERSAFTESEGGNVVSTRVHHLLAAESVRLADRRCGSHDAGCLVPAPRSDPPSQRPSDRRRRRRT